MRCPLTRKERNTARQHKHGGDAPSLAVEGAITTAVFETYVEQVLAPTLSRGQVVVMDNLLMSAKESELGSSSKGGAVRCSTYQHTHQISTPSRKHSAK